MTEQDPARGDESVARLIQAAATWIHAYERKSTANDHYLEAAVDALNDSRPRTRLDPGPSTPPIAE